MSAALSSATILITGGTGSFGSTMVGKMLDRDVGEIRILSRDEAKQDQMRHRVSDDRVRFYLGDVRDISSVEQSAAGVDYIFHAAALKQVPSCEFFPLEAVRTNVVGSSNVLEAAHRAGVRTVVCLSTDKAVYPINAMGLSKALMEKTVQAFARNHPRAETKVCVTRYGNVMYSRGSVIPLFVSQIKAGEPVTVTDPTMTRFMMTLDDSVSLVDYAFAHGESGDLLIRESPGCTLETLVSALGNLFAVEPKANVIGIRHGEKLHETLASREELSRSTHADGYFRIALDARDLNYEQYFEEGETKAVNVEGYGSNSTYQLNVSEAEEVLLQVPEIRRELTEAAPL